MVCFMLLIQSGGIRAMLCWGFEHICLVLGHITEFRSKKKPRKTRFRSYSCQRCRHNMYTRYLVLFAYTGTTVTAVNGASELLPCKCQLVATVSLHQFSLMLLLRFNYFCCHFLFYLDRKAETHIGSVYLFRRLPAKLKFLIMEYMASDLAKRFHSLS